MTRAKEREAVSRVLIHAALVHSSHDGWLTPGQGRKEWFQDHVTAPRMVVVPPGTFEMGSPPSEKRWRHYDGREEPQHSVVISKPFAVSAAPVTRGQFAAFAADSGFIAEAGAFILRGRRWWALYLDKGWHLDPALDWRNPGYPQTDDHPVVCVSWEAAREYCGWLSRLTGKRYRLLSEAEWEYCCRAGTRTAYSTGDRITRREANFRKRNRATTPVCKFPPNPWGLYDMHGNVWEWVEDEWHPDYGGSPPADGAPWNHGDDDLRGLRGGAWDTGRVHFRSADRGRGGHGLRNNIVGFRVARDI